MSKTTGGRRHDKSSTSAPDQRKAGDPDALAPYRGKRDFEATPEPPGKRVPRRGRASTKRTKRALAFCVQKHAARAVHYDLRLEHNGVLLSWAVPKGPSLNPADKRLAMRTEDHPLQYKDFEGLIPSGYGAGIMMLWDQGTWTPLVDNVAAALEKGDLKFELHGVKLKGSWAIIRSRRTSDGREQWLLIKHRDDWAGDVDVTSLAPDSVKSFGDFGDILAASEDPDVWSESGPPTKGGESGKLLREAMSQAKERGAVDGTARRAVGSQTSTKGTKGTKNAGKAKKAKSAERGKSASTRTPERSSSTKREPSFSNLGKVLYPAGFTKGQVIDYYRRIAPFMLPHLRGRAMTLKRYPNGTAGKFFFEKNCPSHKPDWIKTARVPGRSSGGKTVEHCLIDDEPALLWAANLAALELHVPMTRAKQPDGPTAMVFDLDPGPPATLLECCRVGLLLRDTLRDLGLDCYPKVSGGKGLHVYVPLNTRGITSDQTKDFARTVAETFERDDPKRITATMARNVRPGKIFIDWSQNDRHKTTAAVYSLRAKDRPTVSAPVTWDEVEHAMKKKDPKPLHIEADDAIQRAERLGDLFEPVLTQKQRLPEA